MFGLHLFHKPIPCRYFSSSLFCMTFVGTFAGTFVGTFARTLFRVFATSHFPQIFFFSFFFVPFFFEKLFRFVVLLPQKKFFSVFFPTNQKKQTVWVTFFFCFCLQLQKILPIKNSGNFSTGNRNNIVVFNNL